MYTDKDTTMYVEKQKEQQYIDLRHALQVMGKIPSPHQLDQVLTHSSTTVTVLCVWGVVDRETRVSY